MYLSPFSSDANKTNAYVPVFIVFQFNPISPFEHHFLLDSSLKRLDHGPSHLVLDGAHHRRVQRILKTKPDLQFYFCLVLPAIAAARNELPSGTQVTEQSLVAARNGVPVVAQAIPAARLDGPSRPIAVHARGERFAEGPVADAQEGLCWVVGDGIARCHGGRGEEREELGVGFDGGDDLEERGGGEW